MLRGPRRASSEWRRARPRALQCSPRTVCSQRAGLHTSRSCMRAPGRLSDAMACPRSWRDGTLRRAAAAGAGSRERRRQQTSRGACPIACTLYKVPMSSRFRQQGTHGASALQECARQPGLHAAPLSSSQRQPSDAGPSCHHSRQRTACRLGHRGVRVLLVNVQRGGEAGGNVFAQPSPRRCQHAAHPAAQRGARRHTHAVAAIIQALYKRRLQRLQSVSGQLASNCVQECVRATGVRAAWPCCTAAVLYHQAPAHLRQAAALPHGTPAGAFRAHSLRPGTG